MCGICGELAFRGRADVAGMSRSVEALRSRGPDGGGMFMREGLVAGHRRLSILDLSSASDQPMLDSDLGLGIVFNGCIYNFRDLRTELEGKGYRFFSGGDTEVVLKAYHAWGRSCVTRFKGMFAFAIWERASGRVMLARDRLGIKPLYYAETADRLRFASTLPALLAAGGVDTSIDRKALHHYMSWHAVVPAPNTILNGVKKLPPATLLTIEANGSRRQESSRSLSVGTDPLDLGLSEADWRDLLSEKFS